MPPKLGAKDFKPFWYVTAFLVAGIALFLAFRFNEVAKLNHMPEGNLNVILYLLVTDRKAWISGITQTVAASVLGTMFGFLIAIVMAYIRENGPTKRDNRFVQYLKYTLIELEKLYVTVLRGTPMMVQACIVYYAGFAVTRAMMPNASITEVNQIWSLFTAALITVSLNSGAYQAEVLRGGIYSVDQGQKEAAFSLGFSTWQSMIRIIYPQAIRNCLPSIINELINNIKGTSVLTVIGFGELMFATSSIAGKTYQYLPTYLLSALIYLFLVVSLSNGLNKLVGIVFKEKKKL